MLKKVLVIALAITSLTSSVFAAIPRDQMHIGGLKTGMTMQQVAAVYGMPKADTSGLKGAKGMYYIAGGLINGWVNENGFFAKYTVSNNLAGSERIISSGGIHVGMTPTEVINCLGQPDKHESFNNIVFYDYKSKEDGIAGHGYPDWLLLRFDNGRLTIISINQQ